MSRRQRQRREAMESRYLAMIPAGDETDDMDWEDADYDSLAVYREAEGTDHPGDAHPANQTALQP